MTRFVCTLAAALVLAHRPAAGPPGGAPRPAPPDGVYAVVRDGAAAEDVLPLKDGEALAVDRHRYAKGAGGPPRYLVVRSAPAVALDLDGEPEAITAGAEVVGVRLKLKPAAAAALERLTRDQVGRQVAVVVGGEVVTAHKVRDPIRGGQVQVTGCAPGSAGYLLGQLKSRPKGR